MRPLKEQFKTTKKRAAVIAASTLAGGLLLFNNPVVLQQAAAVRRVAAKVPCVDYPAYIDQTANGWLKDALEEKTVRPVHEHARDTRAVICNADTRSSRAAEGYYSPSEDVTYMQDPKRRKKYEQAHAFTTHAHELYHIWQIKSAKTGPLQLGHRYDSYSNTLGQLYMEAAAIAYETMAAHEYLKKNPEQYKDIEFLMVSDMLAVYGKTLEKSQTAGAPENQARQQAAQAVFDFFLTGDGPAILAREHYKEPVKNPVSAIFRIGAQKRATRDELADLTKLPDGTVLYAYHTLPSEKEVADGNFLPGKVTAKP